MVVHSAEEKKAAILYLVNQLLENLSLSTVLKQAAYQYLKWNLKPGEVDSLLDDLLPVLVSAHRELKNIRES